MNEEKSIFIFDGADRLLGTFFVTSTRGKETYSFEYNKEVLSDSETNAIPDPDIAWTYGRQFKATPGPYGVLSDAAPDRWGRTLIRRNHPNRYLGESDFLLLSSDITRTGAYRFKESLDGPFLAEGEEVPPYRFLNALEQAAHAYDDFGTDLEWKILLSPGSSLGGARPKACVYDKDGSMFLAKFGHRNDDYDIPSVEYFTYLLARACEIDITESRLIHVNGRGVFLTKRFDRLEKTRLPYVSFMCLLGTKDGENERYSYLDLAEEISRRSMDPQYDLRQLFQRICFSILAHNYDDHLRNHGMLNRGQGWRLSPCFDINISPYPGQLSLAISPVSEDRGLEELCQNASYFRIEEHEAESIVHRIRAVFETLFLDFAKQAGLNDSLAKTLADRLGLTKK